MTYRDELIDKGDLDELTNYVDRLIDQADWDELVWVRDDCRAAAARGKQLWPVTAYVNYALALRAPGDYAASAIEDAAGPGAAAARFGFGPLPEVACVHASLGRAGSTAAQRADREHRGPRVRHPRRRPDRQ